MIHRMCTGTTNIAEVHWILFYTLRSALQGGFEPADGSIGYAEVSINLTVVYIAGSEGQVVLL